jgi:TRAP-type C4-dicarboxylate transport system substrate-binding protein
MKSRCLRFIAPLALSAACLTSLSAQDPGGDRPNPSDRARFEKWLEKGPLSALTPEERKQFEAAHMKASGNPKVKAAALGVQDAEKNFRATMGRVIVEIDPTLKTVMAVMAKSRQDLGPGSSVPDGPEAFGELTPEERRRLHDATEKAMDKKAVRAATDNKREREKIFHEVTNAAMVQADPGIAPILKKVEKAAWKNQKFDNGPRYQESNSGPPPPPPF